MFESRGHIILLTENCVLILLKWYKPMQELHSVESRGQIDTWSSLGAHWTQWSSKDKYHSELLHLSHQNEMKCYSHFVATPAVAIMVTRRSMDQKRWSYRYEELGTLLLNKNVQRKGTREEGVRLDKTKRNPRSGPCSGRRVASWAKQTQET